MCCTSAPVGSHPLQFRMHASSSRANPSTCQIYTNSYYIYLYDMKPKVCYYDRRILRWRRDCVH